MKCIFKQFVSSLILPMNIDGALVWLGAEDTVVNGAEILMVEVD